MRYLNVLGYLFAVLVALGCSAKTTDVQTQHEEAGSSDKKAVLGNDLAAKITPVTDTYHGTQVTDPYRWLENWDDPEVQAWSKKLDTYTRKKLAALPHIEAIKKRVENVLSRSDVSYDGVSQTGPVFFALKHQPPKRQPLLVRLTSLSDLSSEQIVLDPNALDSSGSTTIDFYRPSPDASKVAVSLSQGGSESGDVHVYDVATGKPLGDIVPRVNGGTAGGDLAWHPDGSGFFYSRYPRGNERPAADANFYTQVYFHKLNTPTEQDRYEIGKDFPRIAEIELTAHEKTGRILATVQEGDGGKFAHFMRGGKTGAWTKLTEFGDGHVQIVFGPNSDLFIVSTQGAPRGKVLRMPGNGTVAKARTIIPEGKDTIVTSFWGTRSLLYVGNRLFVTYQLGGPSTLRVFDKNGKKQPAPEQLANATTGSMIPVNDKGIAFASGSYTQPVSWFTYFLRSKNTDRTALVKEAPIDLTGVTVERKFATSKDGTKVPVNIMIPPGAKRDGSTPAVVTGYGGFGISLSPRYRAKDALLLEQGIIVAVANLRGGGEFGEDWHRGGYLTNKQNVFDDFAAVLKLLVEENYTSHDKLVIQGGSNGGLLMGALLTQHPTLMKAVVASVGIYDMLRVERSPNGAFNVTEFGTVKDKNQFQALYAYSPYHHVVDGAEYPSILLTTGANDPRVDPMQSRKFAARLLAANPHGDRVFLRTSFNTGHGNSGTPLHLRILETADIMAFILNELEHPFVMKTPSVESASLQ